MWSVNLAGKWDETKELQKEVQNFTLTSTHEIDPLNRVAHLKSVYQKDYMDKSLQTPSHLHIVLP